MNEGYKIAGKFAGKFAGRSAGKGFKLWSLLNYLYLLYKTRVEADSGTINNVTITKDAYKNLPKIDSIKFGWMAGAGSKKRTSTIYSYFTKLYSLDKLVTHNDAVQTTESSQPRVTGNIAPTDTEALQNQNGEARFMTHPTISFAANEAWSVTTALNWNGKAGIVADMFGESSTCRITIKDANIDSLFRFNLTNTDVSSNSSSVYTTSKLIGKVNIISFISNGSGVTSLYVNGVFVENINFLSNFNFGVIMRGRTPTGVEGELKSHIIRNIALTASEVLQEATFLRSKYPEIPNVVIGSQTWALRNCDMVASTNGTVIALASSDADWATGVARWRFNAASVDNGSWAGKLYNKAARDVLKANPPSGWHAATEAELIALTTNGGNALKVTGINYWTTTGGTNTTGFSAVGSGSLNADGTSNAVKNTATFWCADSDKVLKLYHDSNVAEIVASGANEGHAIRLVKD